MMAILKYFSSRKRTPEEDFSGEPPLKVTRTGNEEPSLSDEEGSENESEAETERSTEVTSTPDTSSTDTSLVLWKQNE